MPPELARLPIRAFRWVLLDQIGGHDQRRKRSWTKLAFPSPGATRP
jgi:hypothetical protein